MSANAPKLVGVVGLPEGWSTMRLQQALAQRGATAPIIDPRRLELDLERGVVRHLGQNLAEMDGLALKKLGASYSPHLLDRLEMLRFLAEGGLPIFSAPARVGPMIDRLGCTLLLRQNDIPMPPTVVTEDAAVALEALERLGPCVLKPLYTSKARGMIVLEPGNGCATALAAFREQGHRFFYLQQMVRPGGRDLGLVFLGGQYVASYARAARFEPLHGRPQPGGGKYLACDPGPEVIALAARAQAPFGLDFTCVDVAETADGPVVFEVSAFGGFRGLLESQGVDAAGLYADYILEKLRS